MTLPQFFFVIILVLTTDVRNGTAKTRDPSLLLKDIFKRHTTIAFFWNLLIKLI